MNNFKSYEYVDLVLKNNVHAFLRIGDENCVLHEETEQKKQLHFHRYAEMILVTGGTATCTLNNTKKTICRGDLLLIDSSVPHVISDSEEFTCISIGMEGIIFFTNENNFIFKTEEFFDSYCFLLSMILKEAHERKNGYKDVVSNLIGAIISWLARIKIITVPESLPENTPVRYNDGVFVAKNYIDTYYDRNISLNQLCELAFVSPQHLIRQFKSLTGFSPKQYLSHVRIQVAAEKILSSEKNIQLIAKDVGYTDYQSFLYSFKLFVGISPQQFREQYKNSPSKGRKLTNFIDKKISPKIAERMKRTFTTSK